MRDMCDVFTDERAVTSSDYDSTYDSTYETNHSDSSDFAQNEEEGEGGKKPSESRDRCREDLERAIVLHPLLPSPEVGNQAGLRQCQRFVLSAVVDLKSPHRQQ